MERLQRKNILITGGAGFIGSHLCDALIKENNVICLDNLISGNIENVNHLLQLPNFEFIRHDLVEPVDLEGYPELKKFKIPFHGIQEIYHFACPTSHYEKHTHQVETALANSHGTKNALDLAVKYHAKFVFASSSAVYGEPEPNASALMAESKVGIVDHLGNRGCYDEGKRFAEMLVSVYREQYRLDARIIRLFQSYGPRMSLEDNRLIPHLIAKAIVGQPMVIYGEGEMKTSLCYVTDVIEAIHKLMSSELAGPVNLGSEAAVSLDEIAQTIKQLADSQSEISYEAESPYTKHRGIPDISLAKNKLGWFPVVPLSEGLKLTIDDMRGSNVVGLDDVKL